MGNGGRGEGGLGRGLGRWGERGGDKRAGGGLVGVGVDTSLPPSLTYLPPSLPSHLISPSVGNQEMGVGLIEYL